MKLLNMKSKLLTLVLLAGTSIFATSMFARRPSVLVSELNSVLRHRRRMFASSGRRCRVPVTRG